MLDHIGISVSNCSRSRDFYTVALAPLGYTVLMAFGEIVGFGVPPKPDFWISPGEVPASPTHIAFRAESRALVDAFYQAALAAGGKDNGAPGPRPQYHPHYYGAFIHDPDGYNIEACCHTPE